MLMEYKTKPSRYFRHLYLHSTKTRIKTEISKVMLIERNSYLQKLIARRDNGRVKVITGIRRCGKSVLLFDIYKEYLKKTGIKDNQIIEVHLDEKVNAEYRNPMNLDNYLHKRIGRKRSQLYVLIDEIQEVEPIQNPWLPDNKEAKITFVDVLIGLMNKKNVILQGAPGVGKTFAAKRLAYSILRCLIAAGG